MKPTRPILVVISVSTLIVTSFGCSSLANRQGSDGGDQSFIQRMPWSGANKDEPEPYPNPVKVAATWTPDTLVQTGRTPTRGFGGRVFFYDEKSRAVPVDGTLIVHGFDDAAESKEQRVKRFEFTPEQFTRHFSQTDLGASYSVWIPWSAIGGPQRRISLVTSFRTVEGKTVQGIPATVLLPGTTEPESEESELAKMSPQYQRYLEAARSGTTTGTGLTTTTIARRTPRRHPGNSMSGNFMRTAEREPVGPSSPDVVVGRSGTPSFELEMRRPTSTPTVLPASAELPAPN